MQSRLLFTLILSIFQPLTATALAAPAIDSGLNPTAREIRLDPKVQIAGTLICEADPTTQGATCNLQIQEDETGRIYRLKDNTATQAMQMYRAGQTNIAVTGQLQDGDTLVVQKASKL